MNDQKSSALAMLSTSICTLALVACTSSQAESENAASPNRSTKTIAGSHIQLFTSNECFSFDDEDKGKSLGLPAAVVGTLVDKGVDILFSAATNILKASADPDDKVFTAHKNTLVNKDKFPLCLQFLVGDIYTSKRIFDREFPNDTSGNAKLDELIESIVSSEGVNDVAELKAAYEKRRKFIRENRLHFANEPKFFLELFIDRPDDLNVISASPTLISFGEASQSGIFDQFDDNTRDFTVSVQVGTPTKNGVDSAGEPMVFVLESVAQYSRQQFDPGVVETKWVQIEGSTDAIEARAFKVDVTETKRGSELAKTVLEIFSGVEEDLKTAVKEGGRALLIAEPQPSADDMEMKIVEFAEQLNVTQTSVERWTVVSENAASTPEERRTQALATLKSLLALNSAARLQDRAVPFPEANELRVSLEKELGLLPSES